jgi:hypothetical protein
MVQCIGSAEARLLLADHQLADPLSMKGLVYGGVG